MYEYKSGEIPPFPNDFVIPDEVTDVQLLTQMLHNQEKTIEFLYYELNRSEEKYQSLHKDNTDLIGKIDTLISQGQSGDSTLQDSNTQLLSKLDGLQSTVSNMELGSNTVITYGILYIPLAIIIFLLWRFFATFLRTAR